MPDVQSGTQPADTTPSAPRWPLLVGLCLLLLIGWEAVATWRQHASAAQESDWKTTVALLRKHHQAGDPVLVAPEWAEPAARAHLGGILDLDLATLSDVDRYARVWELSIRNEHHRWLRDRAPLRRWAPSRVALSLYQKPPALVLHDFRAQLLAAEVTLVGTRRTPCRRRGKRFVCGGNRWAWVGVKLAEINHRPYRCIYAHPTRDARLRLSFADVTLGTTLVGYTGIDDFASRRSGTAPVFLQVTIDGELLHSVKQPNEGRWRRFEIDTTALAGPRHHVRFEITADNDEHRTFCFHAEARK